MSNTHPLISSEVRLTVSCLVLAVLYFLLAKLGLLFAYEQENTSALWLPAGLAVAATLILGYRIWPGIFLGAFALCVSAGTTVPTAVMIATGNTGEALMAVFLTLRLIGTRYPLNHPHHVIKFIFAAAIVATILSAYIGVFGLMSSGVIDHANVTSIYMKWWMGNIIGVILFAPLILAWVNKQGDKLHKQHLTEVLLLVFSTILISGFVFGGWSTASMEKYPFAFLPMPVIVWAAFRFGQRGSTTVIALIAFIAIIGTYSGHGPFVLAVRSESILMYQYYMAVIAITALALAALIKQKKIASKQLQSAHDTLEQRVDERTHALVDMNHALEESESKWRSLTEHSPDNIMLIDPEGKIIFINHTVPDLSVEQVIGTSVYDYISTDQQDKMRDCYERVAKTGRPGRFQIDYVGENATLNFENRVGPVFKDNKIVALTVNSRDVTRRTKNEAKIRQLNKQMGLLLESTTEGIFGVDENMICTFVNRAAADMLGLKTKEIVGRDMLDLLYARDRSGAQKNRNTCLIKKTIVENQTYVSEGDEIWLNHEGSFPVKLTSSPISEDGLVIGAAVVFHNATETRTMQRKMDFLIAHDALTGLVNRREFESRLQRALDNAITENSHHVLCFLDLDQFKVINDTCGHIAGDELLRQLTVQLQKKVRHNDTLSRLGGDEFGILMEHCETDQALKVVETIRSSIKDFHFIWEDKPYVVGVSIGVTALTSSTSSVSDAMSEADSACYMAKDSGRNRIHVFESDDAGMVQRYGEMQWVSRIHQAFEDQRLSLVCQAIMPTSAFVEGQADNHQDEIYFEILLRMTDENGERIPPVAFIPAAERYNLMPGIDRWVVRTTLKWLQENQHQLNQYTFFTINLSGHSLNDESFLNFVQSELKKYNVSSNQICFEITETAVVSNLTQAIHFIKTLKASGCQFALDDFGSGMSSFSYLKNLPVDFLKIDGNFVRDIVDDPIDFAMVEAVNRVGQVMGIKTIAEFVENDAVLQKLCELGVDYVQGYGIAKPRALNTVFEVSSLSAG